MIRRIAILTALALTAAGCGSLRSEADIIAASGVLVSEVDLQAAPVPGVVPESTDPVDDGAVTAESTVAITGGPAGPAAGPTGTAAPGAASPAAASDGRPVSIDALGPATGSVVKVGHIGTYSGVMGAIFGGGRVIAGVWERYINEHGGLNGHRVEVIIGDDRGDPARSASLVRDFVENQGVVAFFGNIVPLAAQASEQYLRDKGIPVVGGDSSQSIWRQSTILFPHGTSYGVYSLEGAAYAARTGGVKKAAVLYCGEVFACDDFESTLTDANAGARGFDMVYRARVSIAQPDFTAECLGAKNAGADLVMLAVDAASILRVTRACSQQGYAPTYLAAGFSIDESLRSDPNLEGMIMPQASFPFPDRTLPAAQIFQTAAERFAPDLIMSGAVSSVWAAGMMLALASHNGHLSADDPKPSEILDGLYTFAGETLDGLVFPLTFTPGQPAPLYPCFFLMTMESGNFAAPNGSRSECAS